MNYLKNLLFIFFANSTCSNSLIISFKEVFDLFPCVYNAIALQILVSHFIIAFPTPVAILFPFCLLNQAYKTDKILYRYLGTSEPTSGLEISIFLNC